MQALASLLLAAAWMEPLPPPLATLRNPEFDTDPVTAPAPTNWRWYLDSGTGGELVWDAAVGSPTAGSGRVRNFRSGAREDFWGQCVKLAPGPFTLRAAVSSQLKDSASCELRIEVLNKTDCNATAGLLLTASVANTANNAGFETLQITRNAPPGSGAAWVSLIHRQTTAAIPGYSYCHFDHVEWDSPLLFTDSFE
ncbi:MAG TPA: hypothetical protein VLF18_20035 [Tahibacter sp.]|uniref:hypothetical protein n=1 Tax=Tahibacter sp. TaxID=2056211 RepID=UPI002C278EA4|nr:hypothetical protein [Tahibacter sp.]HSX62482.1 hypothetical protein [Tahibacter sp.]